MMDEGHAFHHFFGMTLEQAEQLFAENALYYAEDLMWMPGACLQYYLVAFCNYLLSNASIGDSDGASSFFTIVEDQSAAIAGDHDLTARVDDVLSRLEAKQDWYDASVEIYGDFGELSRKCQKLIQAAQ